MSDPLTFRCARRADADAAMSVLAATWNLKPTDGRYGSMHGSLTRHPEEWRIGLEAQRPVCAIHMDPSAVWFGDCRVNWIDVGEVSVHPDLQGRGIGTVAMQDVLCHLREQGVAVSRLGGQVRFYSRFGYERFPRCYVEFRLPEQVSAGFDRHPLRTILADGLRAVPGRVRPLDPDRDIPEAWDVAEGFNRHRTGSRVWRRPSSRPAKSDATVVYDQAPDDRSAPSIRGLATYCLFPRDWTTFEAKLTIYHMAYRQDCPEALKAMLCHALIAGIDAVATRATAYLPFDAPLVADLDASGLEYNLCQTVGSGSSNMIQVINLRSLLTQIAPELDRRTRASDWRGSVTIQVGSQQAGLCRGPGGLSVTDGHGSDAVLTMTHADLVRTVLGIMPPVWPRLVAPGSAAWQPLMAMFPPAAGAFNT